METGDGPAGRGSPGPSVRPGGAADRVRRIGTGARLGVPSFVAGQNSVSNPAARKWTSFVKASGPAVASRPEEM